MKKIFLIIFITFLFPAFDKAFSQDSRQERAMTHYNWGNEFSGNSEYKLAIVEYNGTIELMPDYYRAYYRRGNAYYMTGDHHKAINDYNKALKLMPNYPEAYFNRGIAYFNRGRMIRSVDDVKNAIADFEAVLRIEPNNAQAKQYLEMARRFLDELIPHPARNRSVRRVPRNTSITIYTYTDENKNPRIELDEQKSALKIITDFPDKK
jgi:tetratricopeptide (TPR) repeat protein